MRRRGGAQELRRPPGPTPCRPPGQAHHIRRWPPAGDLGQGLQRPVGAGLVGEAHDPAPDPPALEGDAHHRPHPDLGGQVIGDEVVEDLVDREVRQDPCYLDGGYASPRACFTSSRRERRSHVNSFSERPKWPYAAVLR